MRRRKWREGKVRPIPGNSPHERLVGRVISSSLMESLRRSLPRHCFPHLQRILGAQYAFLRHGGIYLVRCGCKTKTKNQTLGWGRAASRWSAPSPGSRTCREDHAPSHRPQMSSGRLFLDRVARQHCPSPLHRHAQITTPPRSAGRKPDISTLQRIGHFYFALTGACYPDGAKKQVNRPPHEVESPLEARRDGVAIEVSRNSLAVDVDGLDLVVTRSGRRASLTGCRDALNGTAKWIAGA